MQAEAVFVTFGQAIRIEDAAIRSGGQALESAAVETGADAVFRHKAAQPRTHTRGK